MKYRSIVIAAALVASTQVLAAEQNAPADERYVDNMVDCISSFIESEQDESTKEQFIAACMQAKAAKQQQPAVRKG